MTLEERLEKEPTGARSRSRWLLIALALVVVIGGLAWTLTRITTRTAESGKPEASAEAMAPATASTETTGPATGSVESRVPAKGQNVLPAKREVPVVGRQEKAEDEFLIEKFDFEWTVVESGESKLIVNKTDETTRIILREGGIMGDSLWLLPADAEAIGKALADVDKYFAKMRNAEDDVSARVEAGNYGVTFHFWKEHGFRVYVAPNEQFSMSSLSLDRSQAKAFAPHLQKAKAMAAYVDRKVKF